MASCSIAAAAADDKEHAREWVRLRPSREQFDVLAEFWRRGLIAPTDRLFQFVPRDAFARERADGRGLLPDRRILATPDPTGGLRYRLLRCYDNLTVSDAGLDRAEAWHIGRAAVLNDRAEFTLCNVAPALDSEWRFSPIGAKCVVHPDGRGAWLYGVWGDDGPPRHESGLGKADCLARAEACVAGGGEARITNCVPLSRAEWRACYAC